MKLKSALAISIALNVGLGITVRKLLSRRKGKPLPRRRPDFDKIEHCLKKALASPPYEDLFELRDFKAKEWICGASLIHRIDDISPHWDTLEELVHYVMKSCDVPGRPSGWVSDPKDNQRMIGTSIEFGYSPEVGYNHPNELYIDREIEKESEQGPSA